MPDNTTSASEARRTSDRLVLSGVAIIIGTLAIAAVFLFLNLPDANAFDARVTQIFVENSDLTNQTEIKLLEILAQSGNAFADTLTSYRVVIFVLLVFATAMMVAALVFLVLLIGLNRRFAQIERTGIQVNSLLISREENKVYLNNMGFKLTGAAMETLSVLAEARMDDDVLTGAALEALDFGAQRKRLRGGGRRDASQAVAGRVGQSDGQRASGQEHCPSRLYAVRGKGRHPRPLIICPAGILSRSRLDAPASCCPPHLVACCGQRVEEKDDASTNKSIQSSPEGPERRSSVAGWALLRITPRKSSARRGSTGS